MKRISLISFIGLALLWACNPMEDVYQNLDNAKEPYKESVQYTLTAADYTTASNVALKLAGNASDSALAKAIKSQQAFNQRFRGSDIIPEFLGQIYPALSKGSQATITYNQMNDLPQEVADLSELYIFSTADYQNLWGSSSLYVETFTPSKSLEANIPLLLNTLFPNDADGRYRFVSYNYSENEPTVSGGLVSKFMEDWSSGTANAPVNGDWINVDKIGTKAWLYKSYSGNLYAQMSSYNSGEENQVWLIHRFDNLDTISVPTLSFDVKVGYWNADCLSILVSEDFDGDPNNINSATWIDITSSFTLPQQPVTGYGNFVNAGSYDLSAYKGKNIYIGFKYVGDGTNNSATTTYQLDNIQIADNTTVFTIDSFSRYFAVYKKSSGNWAKENSVIALQDADYQTMGVLYIPTDKDNFYLTQYLTLNYPYSPDGSKKTFAYLSGATKGGAKQFIKVEGAWQPVSYVEIKTDKFFNNGTKWFFDPTVYLTPGSSDYQLLVNWVYDNLNRSYGSNYGNDEFYYGASAYYSNWDLRLSKRTQFSIPGFESGTEEEKIALTWKRLEEGICILLSLKYPDAVKDIDGFPVYYWVDIKVYQNDLTTGYYKGIFQKTSDQFPYFERQKGIEDLAVTEGKLTNAQISWNR